ncbi:Vps5-domain-containing protein [Hesseltinella vesiculosa]|uniref:Vps5-domain-containing protein n=1 Tax=Hesseltinella vesiculosa TaxID=101127 RepID=A0A1X2GKE0_9FUNG|nr:Vps5-domain-containing protein [Hesseltinella vesiculosa]
MDGAASPKFDDALEVNPFQDLPASNDTFPQDPWQQQDSHPPPPDTTETDGTPTDEPQRDLPVQLCQPDDEQPSEEQPLEDVSAFDQPAVSLASDIADEPSEIVEQYQRPYFEVSVEDPQKVGDAINAHIVYKVKTKTDSPAFRSSEMVVARRYRDFLWLYNQLTFGNPGVIVPPVPEKHALGRFQDEFVESRRIALERCLRKIVTHPMLHGDPDLKVFLESESFNSEKRTKRTEPDMPKLGFMRSFSETLSNAGANPFAKFIETDDWFITKKTQLDTLEAQLKALMKSVEALVKQRKELGAASFEFGESMFPLASAELNRNLSVHLTVLGNIQKELKELHEEQARFDILTLEHTIDEYIRIIGSIRLSFNARTRAYQAYQQTELELQKKVTAHDKLKSQQKIKPEKVTIAAQEMEEVKQRLVDAQQEVEDISKLIRNELDRFDQEKVEDFRASVEAFLQHMIDHQKKVIALWESYFEQTETLDQDSDGGDKD